MSKSLSSSPQGGKSFKKVGKRGEDAARKYLRKLGYQFIEANWRIKSGEIDLVFLDKETLVIVEVKSRYDSTLGRKHLLDSITSRKKRKLRALCQIYLKHHAFRKNTAHRIDVVGVILNPEGNDVLEIRHIKGAM